MVKLATWSPSIRSSPLMHGATLYRVLTSHPPNLRTRLPGDCRSITRVAKMTNNLQATSADERGIIEFDAIIIGAGVSGFAASIISAASARKCSSLKRAATMVSIISRIVHSAGAS